MNKYENIVKVRDMHVAEFSMIDLDRKPEKVLAYEVTATTKLNPEEGLIGVEVAVIVKERGSGLKLAFMKIFLEFSVKNFESVIAKDEADEYKIPYSIEAMTRRIAISTTRGVMFSYLKGTYLHRAILPIVPELLKPKKDIKEIKEK